MSTAVLPPTPRPPPASPAGPAAGRSDQDAAALAVVDDPVEQDHFTQWVVEPGGLRLGESALQISGMHCAACAGILEAAIGRVPGVHAVQVGAASQRATVRWDPQRTQPSALIAAVRSAGYDAVPDAAAPARLLRRAEHRQALWRLFVAGFCGMQVMMMATPAYVAGPGELAPDMRQLLAWGGWLLTLPVLLFSAGPFFRGAWLGLKQRRIGMDLPVALGVFITFVASTGATFEPGGVFGHEVYFDSLTMFVGFLLGARYLEMLSRHRAAEALEASLARLPETALRVAADGGVQAVSVQRLVPGDVVRVPVGQAFPADGVLLEGSTQADESLLTGESAPVPKPQGAAVVAGSINHGAPVSLQVQRVGGDTRLQAIVAMMRGAMSQRPAAAALGDRWAAPFLWTVLLLAAGAAAVWSVIDPSRAVWVAVSVLIVTCPCALSLAAPATLVAAARGLAQRGVLLQRLDALEALAGVQHVVFDKTGTLTDGQPVARLELLTAAGQARLGSTAAAWRTAAALAAWSAHPASAAVVAAHAAARLPEVDAAAAAGAADPWPWQARREVPGHGLEARDAQGRTWRLGSGAWAGSNALPQATQATLWLACDGQPMAGFTLADRPRPDARAAVQALRDDGLQVLLLSGDTPQRAQALGDALGLHEVIGGATPEDKLAAVARLQAAGGRVAMVGDGINDAPVLARADVSLAMGQGALVARSQADAVLTSNRLTDIVLARRLAQRAMRIVRQNMVWAASYNALSIPLALAGFMPPWAAGLGMAASSLLVTFNALRAGRGVALA